MEYSPAAGIVEKKGGDAPQPGHRKRFCFGNGFANLLNRYDLRYNSKKNRSIRVKVKGGAA
jgi:hypothetical protein